MGKSLNAQHPDGDPEESRHNVLPSQPFLEESPRWLTLVHPGISERSPHFFPEPYRLLTSKRKDIGCTGRGAKNTVLGLLHTRAISYGPTTLSLCIWKMVQQELLLQRMLGRSRNLSHPCLDEKYHLPLLSSHLGEKAARWQKPRSAGTWGSLTLPLTEW